MSPRAVGITFARGGSKGVPRKNLRALGGIPLLAHAIRSSLGSSFIRRHVVSTDDAEIAATAKHFGAEVPFMRPPELASDDAAEILSWKHAIEALRARGDVFDVIVSVPATAPLRQSSDIDAVVSRLLETQADLVITVSTTHHSPYFNMVTLSAGDRAQIVVKRDDIVRRQDAPITYGITTVAYAARPDYVLSVASLFAGDVRAVRVPAERAIDIDTELDLAFAEFLYHRRKERT